MALIRGTGPAGLRGVAWCRPLSEGVGLIRPMLGATREQALAFLAALEQGWREDATNADPDRTRARLRRDVLPVLRELNAGAALNALALSDRVRAWVNDHEALTSPQGEGEAPAEPWPQGDAQARREPRSPMEG